MKIFEKYIFSVALVCSFFVSCNKMEDDLHIDDADRTGLITPYCTLENNSLGDYVSGRMSTKALINSDTPVEEMLGNFLVIDQNNYNSDGYTTNWGEAYVSESSISTIPDPTVGMRTISLHPERPYDTNDKDNISRMVGWYPRTYEFPDTSDDRYIYTKFKSCSGYCVVDDNNHTVSAVFTNLDGSKDVMVSDAREGSYNIPFNYSTNKFTFKHYLSAVRVFAKAENSSQDLGAWGEITKVIVLNQPSSCKIPLPQTPGNFADTSQVIWGTENMKNPLITDEPIFGDKDINNPQNLVPEVYPVKISGSTVDKYLGYSLIRPNKKLWIQIHTNAGVYDVSIDPQYNLTVAGGSITKTNIFKAGLIYDIHLNFKTDGTISAFLLNQGSLKYYDLTTGRTYTTDDASIFDYHRANCYIINSKPSSGANYDGFCFDATVVGNGEAGMISLGAQSLYPLDVHISPKRADLLWETSPGLISQIELLYGYVRFNVAKESSDPLKYKEGNAVIAVYDKNGEILWSWHIWITDTPKDLSYIERDTKITIMDRNLGATAAKWNGSLDSDPTSGDTLETYGLYYQWGRKDPSMGPPAKDYYPINMITAPYYDYASTKKDAAEVLRLPQPTLEDAVKNPMYLIMPTGQTQTYYFNWLYEKIDFLWGYDKNAGTNERKTIYDPCPYGYKVSGGELSDLFTYASNYTYEDYGQIATIDGVQFYFPYSGYKGVDRGLNSLISSWKFVGQKGDYQSAVVSLYTSDNEYYMHRARNYLSKENSWSEVNVGSYTGHQIEDHTNRRTAAPVRCVVNEYHNRVMAFITPDKYTISSGSDSVKFTLYAKSFAGNISSVKLTVGYHLNGEEDTGHHNDYTLYDSKDDQSFVSDLIWEKAFNYNFNEAPFNSEDTDIDNDKTTGNFRFVLEVKTSDNINKMSSTTIVLAKNTVDFSVDNWLDNLVLIGQPINKQFRIFGDSKPQKVDMELYKPDGTKVSTVDITSNLRAVEGSSYTFDFLCNTSGLSFDYKGWNKVMFKLTFESGEIIITEGKYFKVGGFALTPVTNKDDLNTTDNYLIQNKSNSEYVYDAGNKLNTSVSYNYSNLFRLETSGDGFRIVNVLTSKYPVVDAWGYSIDVKNKISGSETDKFFFEYSSGNFIIGVKPRYGSNKYWRYDSSYADYVSPHSDTRDNTKLWNIYKVTRDDSGTPETQPSGNSSN